MNTEQLMVKAVQAAASARMLLDTRDVNGACNRAYYAMFDAASAALLAASTSTASEVTRTHSGLIADYKGDPIEVSDVRSIVEQAEAFVAAVQARISSPSDAQDPQPPSR